MRRRTGCARFGRQALGALAAVMAMTPAPALPQTSDESHTWRATVYGWFPAVSGATRLATDGGSGGDSDVTIDPGDILDALDFVFMGQIERRGRRWGGFADLVYLEFSESAAAVHGNAVPPLEATLDAELELDGFALTVAASYTAIERPGLELLAVGGARLLDLDAALTWSLSAGVVAQPPRSATGNVAAGQEHLDAVVGVRGRASLGTSRWSVPFYVDIGGGDSDATWQAVLGLAYRFDWGELTIVQRRLEYDFAPSAVLRELGFSGIAVGASWRW